jgi:prolyl 4-hydroxylase
MDAQDSTAGLVDADPDDGLEALRVRADRGEPVAMRLLGARLLTGDRAPLAQQEGYSWIERAARAGDVAALEWMATLTGLGAFAPQSWPLAFDYLRQAAERGGASAQAQIRLLAAGPEGAAPVEPATSFADLVSRIDVGAWIAPPPRKPLWETPRIRMAERFAAPAVCDWIKSRAQDRMRPAMMYDGETKTEAVDPHRTCSDYQFDILNTDVVLLLVRARVAELTKLPTVAMEPPRVFHYALGENIMPHYDRCNSAEDGYGPQGGYLGDRIVTFLLYLNDGFDGGELDFPKSGVKFKGMKGDALYFAHVDASGKPDPLSLHAGLTITRGEKWVLSQWIHDRPFGVPEAALSPG